MSSLKTDLLPVPYDCLVELGLTDEQIREAIESKPLVLACQAPDHPGAWYDVDRAKRALRALGQFKHTKGRWAGVPIRLGQGLDPWQVVWVLAPIFGWVYHDPEIDRVVRVIRTAWIEVPRKAGKALALDTPVPTPAGWATQGELKVGDEVFAGNGEPTRVVATTNVMDGRPCYRLTFSDGESIVADAGHLWRTSARKQGLAADATALRTTQELFETATYGTRRDRNHSVALAEPLALPDADLPIDPYVLGYWLGDGDSAGASFTVHSEDLSSLAAEVAAAGYHLGEPRWRDETARVTVSTSPVRTGSRDTLSGLLRAAGLLGNKHVPQNYLRASAPQRLALLQGLMDSDGTISARGVAGNITRCEFTGMNEMLCFGVLELARSVGLKATLIGGRAMLHGRDVGPKYRVSFTAYSSTPVFRLARKMERQVAPPAAAAQRARSRTRQLVSIDPVESVPVKCIQVDSAAGMYLVGRSFIPTHNSTLSSAISNILLLADGEMGAEVYNAAGSTLQAGRVFEDAKRMLLTSPAARKRINPLKEVVEVPRTGGVLRCLSRVAETAHGLNVSGAVVDEVHTLRLLRALVEAIETGVGARDQPLIIFITTADDAEEGTVYDEKHSYTRNLANRVVEDTRHYGVIWAAEHTDDPFSDETIKKANPGAGKSPTWTYLHGEARKAQNNPTYLPTYLRLTLNLRQRNQSRWFDLNDWDACQGADKRASLRKRRAWGGLDLSAVSDLSAWSVWVEPIRPGAELELLTRLWVPEGAVEDLEKRLQVPLSQWIDQGHVQATDGDVIDYSVIESAVIGDTKHFDMQRISYDRMFAGQLVQNVDLATKGVDVLPVAQTFSGLSAACKEMERLVRSRAFRHDSNPALRWMASAVEVKNDGLDNIRPVKPNRAKASSRIDGIQAAVTGLDGWVRRPKQAERRKVVVGRG